MKRRWLYAIALSLVLGCFAAESSRASYDSHIYDNLQRSRDALLGQRSELERARADVGRQVDTLQAKLNRIDQYLRQVDNSLRDVDDALDHLK